MTYYEELGLPPYATEAEVKRSYKRLTLLLHPDQHQDPEIKVLADVQMRRLNEIVETLTDPERRRAYDRDLRTYLHNVRQNSSFYPLIWLRNNRGWILVTGSVFLFVGAALLIPSFDPASQPAVAQVQASDLAVTKPPVEHVMRVPANKPVARAQRPTVPVSVRAQFPKAGVEPLLPEAPSLTANPEPMGWSPNPMAIRPPVEANLVGKWIFTPDPLDRPDPKTFPAEYVELTILAAENRLRGNYRSRYKLSDHSLSPYANFIFDGPANAGTFDWRGDGGARGQVTLQFQSEDTLQVNWFATKMGTELSLGSGSATVFRFR